MEIIYDSTQYIYIYIYIAGVLLKIGLVMHFARAEELFKLGVSSVMLSSEEMDATNRVQNLDKAVCLSHSSYTLGKGMAPTTFPSAKGK